jgi:hypothetical protein
MLGCGIRESVLHDRTHKRWCGMRAGKRRLSAAELRAVAALARIASQKPNFLDPADREQCLAFAEEFERLALRIAAPAFHAAHRSAILFFLSRSVVSKTLLDRDISALDQRRSPAPPASKKHIDGI